jgi:hypothetical protein
MRLQFFSSTEASFLGDSIIAKVQEPWQSQAKGEE